ncbi:hypothetical protein SDC9_183979 [bioreactor metagenome]|uniref:Uncharacterized protein n=1 Tax=bioreactor metagenome TaxID=1076179 RepID=A0A645HCL9_9ZZZZ
MPFELILRDAALHKFNHMLIAIYTGNLCRATRCQQQADCSSTGSQFHHSGSFYKVRESSEKYRVCRKTKLLAALPDLIAAAWQRIETFRSLYRCHNLDICLVGFHNLIPGNLNDIVRCQLHRSGLVITVHTHYFAFA